MNYNLMPFDVQRCNFSQGLFSEGIQEVHMRWPHGAPGVVGWQSEAFDISDFDLINVTEMEVVDAGGVGRVSYVRASLELHRKSSYYVSYVLTPMFLFVFIAYSSFFISKHAAPARVAMSNISVLVMQNLTQWVSARLPTDSGSVWIVDFLNTSQAFVLYTSLEYAVVNYMVRIEDRVDKAWAAAAKRFGIVQFDSHRDAATRSLRVSLRRKDVFEALKHASVRHVHTDGVRLESHPTVENSTRQPGEMEVRAKRHSLRDVPNAAAFTEYVKANCGRIDRMLLNPQGELMFRDQHIDIFSRYLFCRRT